MLTGKYVGLFSQSELNTMKTEALQLRSAIMTAHQGYSRPGLSVNRARLGEVTEDLAEIAYAIAVLNGNVLTETYADVSA